MGDRKKASRKRAVGTREHIIAYLTGTRELFDPAGMASTRLAAAVGYPGSSVAFAQLLSGMERSGLIERDVRGRRTYRISLGPAATEAAGVNGLAGMLAPDAGPHAGAGTAGFDYDELARRLLAQLVRRLAGAEPAPRTPAGRRWGRELRGGAGRGGRPGDRAGQRVDQARPARRGERPAAPQLRAAEQSLALARERRPVRPRSVEAYFSRREEGKRRRRRLFQTTKTEERVMVAAAIRGLRKPRAASGMARTL